MRDDAASLLAHPAVTERFAAAPDCDALLTALSDFGSVELESCTPTQRCPARYWMTVRLHSMSSDLVRQVRQPGRTPTEAALRCLVAAHTELAFRAGSGVAALSAYLSDRS